MERLVFSGSALFLTFLSGMAAQRLHLLPARAIDMAVVAWREQKAKPWWYATLAAPFPSESALGEARSLPGLNLVIRVAADNELAAEVRDMRGRLRHHWNVDWFTVWPHPTHLPKALVPKEKMNTHIHGAVVLPDGSLVYSYEYLGLVRLDKDSKVIWRLPYETHHSVQLDDDGTLWVCGQRERTNYDAHRPTSVLPTDEYTILRVSQAGQILNEWDVSQILYQNGYDGLLYMGAPEEIPHTRDDRLHLNDVEPFPVGFESGFYRRGDVLVSLRNINTVFVFEQASGKIKTMIVGRFINQHDPDFVDSNRISVFDNNRRSSALSKRDERLIKNFDDESRIVIYDARTNQLEPYFSGTRAAPFYSGIMGKQQWLPDQHLLITASLAGQAFELDGQGKVVWEYWNLTSPGVVGLMEEVQRLPASYETLFPDTSAPPRHP